MLLRVLDGAGITMSAISLARPTLDDVFLTLTGRSLRDDSPAARPGTTRQRASWRAPARAPGTGSNRMSFIEDTLFVFRRQSG